MVAERKYINIDDKPEFIDLAEAIRVSHEPVSWRLAGVEVAIVAPPPALEVEVEEPSRATAKSRKKELLSLAGAWADVDTDSLIEEIYERRANAGHRTIEW